MAYPDPTYHVSADPAHNRLHVYLQGIMAESQYEAAAEEALDAASDLDPGFDVITDLRDVVPPRPEEASHVRRAQEGLVEAGMDRVVRVIDDSTSTIAHHAFERRAWQAGYEAVTVDSVPAAEAYLDDGGPAEAAPRAGAAGD